MKKIKYILILSLLLLAPVFGLKAANVVTLDAAINIALTSPSMTLVLASGSSFSSMSTTASTVAFTISPGGSITLTSADKYLLNNTHDSNGTLNITCASTGSSAVYTVPSGGGSGDSTITFTPGAALCDAGSTSGAGSSTGGSGGTSTTSAQPATGTQTVSKTVGGESGGSVATTDNKAGMTVPAGLASGNVSMNITPKASSAYSAPAANYSAVASQVYDYSLSAGGVVLTTFTKNVTLTFKYADADIAGLDEGTLKVYYWDAVNSKWVLVGGTVDKANNTVTAEVSHLTVFGVFGEKTAMAAAAAGDLIKLSCPKGATVNHVCKSVYYLGSNSKRYVFPNETTYKSWYADFSGVKIVSSETMASHSIGGNVTLRPGTNLIKITTDPKVYAVEPGSKLRWVESEAVAKKLYGNNWLKKIVDVPDAFFVNYNGTEAVTNKVSDKHPVGALIKYSGSANKYYVAAGPVKRLFASGTAFTNNGFRDEFVLTTDIVYDVGADITAAESGLKTTAGP